MSEKLPECFVNSLLHGLGDNPKCSICFDELTLHNLMITRCNCYFILCKSCLYKLGPSSLCPYNCKPPTLSDLKKQEIKRLEAVIEYVTKELELRRNQLASSQQRLSELNSSN